MSDAEKKTHRVFIVTESFSGIDSRYYEDLAVQAARSGNSFHQGLGVEGHYTDSIESQDIDEATLRLKELYPDYKVNFDRDMGLFYLESTKPFPKISEWLREMIDDAYPKNAKRK